jgi:hypothetical protein
MYVDDRGSQVERSKFGSCILPRHPSSDKSPDEGWSGGLKSRDMETREEGFVLLEGCKSIQASKP